MASKKPMLLSDLRPKMLIVGVYTPYNPIRSMDHYFEEFLNLIKTRGLQYDDSLFMKLREVDKNTFLTKGKLQELADYCQEHDFEEILFSEPLSPLQERNLEDTLDCAIFDREKLILEIFKNTAQTSEGKIQIEMAEMQFQRTRLLGKGKDFAQQAGYFGTRGPGETITEEIRRHFGEKLKQAHRKLERLQKSRDTQRQQRLKSKIPLLCIIGYTNSGKSSLLNQLTKSSVLAEDKLFATLDTTTREFFLDKEKRFLMSDTVGFISNLPHTLIEAFKSTLDELHFATLLIHVVDASNPAWQDQIRVVQKTLEELHVKQPMLYVFNKMDKLDPEKPEIIDALKKEFTTYEPYVCINTRSKEGVKELVKYLKEYKI
ncbi:MAG: GTPase HflX [bacterium]